MHLLQCDVTLSACRLTPLLSPRDRPSAAECLTHPWLWQLGPESDPPTPRTPRERSAGKWAVPPEDREDKENFLELSYGKRVRLEEAALAEAGL